MNYKAALNQINQRLENLDPKDEFATYLSERKINQDVQSFEGWLFSFKSTGSSGTPKEIIHSGKSLLESAISAIKFFSLDETHSTIVTLSLERMGGFMGAFRSFVHGAPIILSHPKSFLEDLKKSQAKVVSVVPTQLESFFDSPDDFNFLEMIFVGGASLSEDQFKKAKSLNLPIIPCFGSSESAAMFAAHPLKNSTLSYNQYELMPHREVEILENGNLVLGAYGLFLNEGDNFFETQDQFTLENNILSFQGRADLIFISGGANINPLRIESALLGYSEISYSLVTSVDDPKWGKATTLLYWSKEEISLETIKEFLKERLEAYEMPKKAYWMKDQPMPSEKPNRSHYQDFAKKVFS